jgi:oligopeptide transport system substrate-binding protein
MSQKKKFTLGSLPLLLCLVAILVTACGGGTSSTTNAPKASSRQQVLVYPEAGVSDIQTFDPGLSNDLPSVLAIDMVFTGLVSLDDNLHVQPQMAQSWQESPDGLSWTFHLRPNLKFSDGTPLTSADVAYSIDRVLQPSEKSSIGGLYMSLVKDYDKLSSGKIMTIIGDSLLTPDTSTIIIKTNKRAAYFLDTVTYSGWDVVEKSLIDRYGNTGWLNHLTVGGGDGPFKVLRYLHGQEIDFVPNPNYYGPHPQLAEVKFPFYKLSDTVYRAYQAGQVDESSIPSSDVGQARTLSNGQFHQVPQLWINYYTMNYLVKPFDNIHIRQAFALAINKDEIVKAVWKSLYLATNHIVPQGMPGYDPGLTGPDGTQNTSGNPTKAKQLLQQGLREEGWTSVSQMPPISVTYPSGSTDSDNEVTAMIQMWQSALGVSVKANPIDFNALLNDLSAATNNPHGMQMWGLGWIAAYPDPQDFLSVQFGKGEPNNNCNYGQNSSADAAQQQAAQQLLNQADANPNQNMRMQQYNQVEQQLVNDVAWLPMEQVTNTFVLKPYVKGMVFNAQDIFPPNDWGNIYIAAH